MDRTNRKTLVPFGSGGDGAALACLPHRNEKSTPSAHNEPIVRLVPTSRATTKKVTTAKGDMARRTAGDLMAGLAKQWLVARGQWVVSVGGLSSRPRDLDTRPL